MVEAPTLCIIPVTDTWRSEKPQSRIVDQSRWISQVCGGKAPQWGDVEMGTIMELAGRQAQRAFAGYQSQDLVPRQEASVLHARVVDAVYPDEFNTLMCLEKEVRIARNCRRVDRCDRCDARHLFVGGKQDDID